MPQHLFQWVTGAWRVDLSHIYPPFLERVLVVLARCEARGASYFAVEGFRTYSRSLALQLEHLKGGPRAAAAGKSAHNFGLAFDFAFDAEPQVPGLQPRWAPGDYSILGEEAQRVGLVWGGTFNDSPHVQWPGFVAASELYPLDSAWRASTSLPVLQRLAVVWDYVSSYGPKFAEVNP